MKQQVSNEVNKADMHLKIARFWMSVCKVAIKVAEYANEKSRKNNEKAKALLTQDKLLHKCTDAQKEQIAKILEEA